MNEFKAQGLFANILRADIAKRASLFKMLKLHKGSLQKKSVTFFTLGGVRIGLRYTFFFKNMV